MLFEDEATLYAKYTAVCTFPSHSMPAVFWMWMWFPSTSVRESCFSSNITRSGRYICTKWSKQHHTLLMSDICLLLAFKALFSGNWERNLLWDLLFTCYSRWVQCTHPRTMTWQLQVSVKTFWSSTSYHMLLQGEMVKATQRVYVRLVWNLIVCEE